MLDMKEVTEKTFDANISKGVVILTVSNNYLKNKVETFDCTIE